MTLRRFAQVDVFTSRAGFGNPVAVVFDADALDASTMQRFAAWTNLSETTFVLTPTSAAADLRLRIFTPRQELPFAGHPVVGSVHAWLDAQPQPPARLTLECAAGLLPLRIDGEGATRSVFVRAPEARLADATAQLGADVASALRLDAALVRTARSVHIGPTWLIAELKDATCVRTLAPDFAAVAALTLRKHAVGIALFGRQHEGDAAIAVRAFCPADGIPEDPVTGSANAAIAAFLRDGGGLAAIGLRYRASQGREIGRDGIVEVGVDAATGAIEIGGRCVTCIKGELDFGGSA